MSDLQQWKKKEWIELDYPMPSQSVKTKVEVTNQMSLSAGAKTKQKK